MVSVLKNKDGLIFAYIEWRLLNEKGLPLDPKDYIFVKDLWIHPEYRGTHALSNLIYLIDKHPISKDAKYVFWRNLKYKRISRSFDRNKAKTKGVKLCG